MLDLKDKKTVYIAKSAFLQPWPRPALTLPSGHRAVQVQVNLRGLHGSHEGPWVSYTFVFGLIVIKLYNP